MAKSEMLAFNNEDNIQKQTFSKYQSSSNVRWNFLTGREGWQ